MRTPITDGPDGASGLIGVEPHGRKWKAKIECDGDRFYLGLFADRVEAAKARARKAAELFGKYAYLNFLDEIDLSAVACDPCPETAEGGQRTEDGGQTAQGTGQSGEDGGRTAEEAQSSGGTSI